MQAGIEEEDLSEKPSPRANEVIVFGDTTNTEEAKKTETLVEDEYDERNKGHEETREVDDIKPTRNGMAERGTYSAKSRNYATLRPRRSRHIDVERTFRRKSLEELAQRQALQVPKLVKTWEEKHQGTK